MDTNVRKDINVQLWRIEGGNLRRLRKERGWTQAELAEKINSNAKYLSPIEKGKRGIGEDMMRRLCKVFGVDESELRKGTEIFLSGAGESLIRQDVRQRLEKLPDRALYDVAKILQQMEEELERKKKDTE